MQLRQYRTELKSQLGFKLELEKSRAQALVLQRCILKTEVVKRCLQAECALFQLTLLLVAHSHVVEQLQGYEVIPMAARQVYYIQNPMGLLKEQESVIELIPIQVSQSTVVQLAQHHWNFICTSSILPRATYLRKV